VLATGPDGFIRAGADHALFVHQTWLLSLYRHLLSGSPPRPVALSNVEQHTWLGYYIVLPPASRKSVRITKIAMEYTPGPAFPPPSARPRSTADGESDTGNLCLAWPGQ